MSDLVAARIHPSVLPQGSALPAITYQRISGRTYPAHGDGPGAERLVRARYQLTCWAADPDVASQVADEVLEALHGLKQAIDGVRIDAVLHADTDVENREPDSGLFRRIVDVFVWHAA